jgi:hypothetical protein
MTSETTENRATHDALGKVFSYISPGTNEGITFALSRLTDDLFGDSFLGGGDISLFVASDDRGVIIGQEASAWTLDAKSGAAVPLPIELKLDLDSGQASGAYTPSAGTPTTFSFRVEYDKSAQRPEGEMLLFGSERSSDEAQYSLALVLI